MTPAGRRRTSLCAGGALCVALLLASFPAEVAGAAEDDAPPTVQEWARQLSAGNLAARRDAAWALWSRKAEATSVLPALAQALRDEDAYVRDTCAATLCHHAWRTDEVVPLVALALADERPQVRATAASFLLGTVPSGPGSLAPLAARLDDDPGDPQVRAAVLAILGRAPGPTTDVSTPRLVELSRDDLAHVRRGALILLGRVGGEDERTLPALLTGAGDADPWVRLAAVQGLARRPLADPRIVPTLGGLLDDPADYTVRDAAMGLGRAGGRAARWIPDLVGVLESRDDPGVRYAAAWALGKILAALVEPVILAHGT